MISESCFLFPKLAVLAHECKSCKDAMPKCMVSLATKLSSVPCRQLTLLWNRKLQLIPLKKKEKVYIKHSPLTDEKM